MSLSLVVLLFQEFPLQLLIPFQFQWLLLATKPQLEEELLLVDLTVRSTSFRGISIGRLPSGKRRRLSHAILKELRASLSWKERASREGSWQVWP